MLAALPFSARPEAERRPPTPTGLEALDELLGGGLPTGKLTSVQADPGCGGLRLAARMLAHQTAGRQQPTAAAIVDGPMAVGAIHPPGLHSSGVRLDRLLIAVPKDLAKTVRAAEELLGHGSFPLVVIRGLLAGAPHARRLLLAAEAGGAAGVILVEGRTRAPPPSCSVRLFVERMRGADPALFRIQRLRGRATAAGGGGGVREVQVRMGIGPP